MSDLQETANEALQQLLGTAIDIKNFTIEQAPDVIQEMVLYYMIISWSGVVGSAMLLTIWGFVLKFITKPFYDNKIDTEDIVFNSLVISILPVGIAIGLFAVNINTAIMTTFAPKYFIVKELASLIN